MPYTGVFRCINAISVPQVGKPEIKDLVPSIGSSTQTYSASSRSLPNSSPTMPCCGKVGLDQPAHHRFGRAIGFCHRIEIADAFIVDAKRRPEERQNGFAGGSRKATNEGGEIDDRHDDSLA